MQEQNHVNMQKTQQQISKVKLPLLMNKQCSTVTMTAESTFEVRHICFVVTMFTRFVSFFKDAVTIKTRHAGL